MTHEEILSLLGGDFKKLALLIGIESVLKVSEMFGGVAVNIPKLDNVHRIIRDREIRQAYDHKTATARKLASKYRLTIRQIYNILGETTKGEANEQQFNA